MYSEQGARPKIDGGQGAEKRASKGSHLGVRGVPPELPPTLLPASVSPGAPKHLPHESFSDYP